MQEVVIIGAGPAGLTAAYELLKRSKEYKVTILEESHAIGGISRTVEYQGNRMDIGGHRFFSKDERIMKWWENIMPLQGSPSYDDLVLQRRRPLKAGGPNPEKEDRVMLVRQRISRIYYNRKFFDYPISMKPKTFLNMGFNQTIKAGFSYLASCVHKLPEDSLENFYINRFGRVLYSMFFEGYTEKVWGRHPREISADWGAQRVKGVSILALVKNLFHVGDKETSLIEEFWYPKYGPGQLWESVAKEVKDMGGIIIKDACVDKVHTNGEKVSGIDYCRFGERNFLTGDYFLSSMALNDLVNSMGSLVPKKTAEIARGLPYRDFVTVGLLVDRIELKNETKIRTLNQIVPDCWIYVQDTKVKMGRIQIFNNWSPYLVEDVEDKVWIGLEYFCQEGDSFWEMSEQKCVDFATHELIIMGILRSEGAVFKSHREKVKKAYPAYFDTYNRMEELISYLDAYDNLYCIGRNGQHRYNNMDHSMATAFAAVEQIRKGGETVDKSSVWNVNTEKEYHEKKQKG